ncbi:MAG: transcriptional regulator NrdR [Candidatus Buchananbacteria bacterium]
MKCPVCHYPETKVTDSRETEEGLTTRRRRQCLRCNFRFSTYEEVEILDLAVVKRDGSKEPYNREKIVNGLRKALEKRPVTVNIFKRLVSAIERDIQIKVKSGEITTAQIGDIIMKHLRRFDQVAYIRFASVYQSFKDAKAFLKELNNLLSNHGKKNAKKK